MLPRRSRVDWVRAGSPAGIGTLPLSGGPRKPTILGMGHAQRQDDACSAEIIYLVIPRNVKPRKRPSRIAIWAQEARCAIAALSGALSLCVLAMVAIYGLYTVKSMAGIDLFADKHLEDFVPIPGYHRW